MLSVTQTIKRLFRHESGSVAAMGAAALMMLIIATGSVIDIARFVNVKSKFSNSIDSALLAAVAVGRNQDINQVATKFFYANFPPEYLNSVVLNNITVTSNPQEFSWTASASGEVKTLFASIIGFDSVSVSHSAKVAWDVNTTMEVVFVTDTTASMCTDTVRAPKEGNVNIIEYRPDYTCKKLNALKEAMLYMIDNGLAPVDNVEGPAFRVGIVPFNHKVKVANPAALPDIMTNSELTLAKGAKDYFTKFDDAEPLSPVVPLTAIDAGGAGKATLKKAIEDISQSPTGKGWTRSSIGVLTAALMLDPRYTDAFKGVAPLAFDPTKVDKVIIMMTDGANMGCCYAAHPEGNYDNQYLYLYTVDNAFLSGLANSSVDLSKWAAPYGLGNGDGLCQSMKKAGIVVYSVVFNVDDNDPGGKEIKDVYKKCASNDQFYFDVDDEESLQLAYKTISQSLLRLRIVY